MSEKDTGGPAFPVPINNAWIGLALRDYFAAKAMQSLITLSDNNGPDYGSARAYEWADKMLEARKS